jgi:hypothetical protein
MGWRRPPGSRFGADLGDRPCRFALDLLERLVGEGAPDFVEKRGVGFLLGVEPRQSLPEARFSLWQGTVEVAHACDADDGMSDGMTTLSGVPIGGYDLVEDAMPDGYHPVKAYTAAVKSGKSSRVTVRHMRAAGASSTVEISYDPVRTSLQTA